MVEGAEEAQAIAATAVMMIGTGAEAGVVDEVDVADVDITLRVYYSPGVWDGENETLNLNMRLLYLRSERSVRGLLLPPDCAYMYRPTRFCLQSSILPTSTSYEHLHIITSNNILT